MKTALLLALALGVPGIASAQDLDADTSSRRSKRDFESEVVREIVRGVYLKGGAGSSLYLLNYGGAIRPVMGLNLSVGQDFIDQERMSVAWEVAFQQALHNGPKFDELASLPGVVQGDIHTFTGLAMIEASAYLSRRFGIGFRAGGGVTMAPILMEPTAYENDVVIAQWGGLPGIAHSGPLVTFGGGPTIEYYTKLSHFSIGADIDALYILNLDLALTPAGYLKYTF